MMNHPFKLYVWLSDGLFISQIMEGGFQHKASYFKTYDCGGVT